jgi:hypothetical protein
MTGSLDGVAVTSYGSDPTEPTNCTKAGSYSVTLSQCISIYNSTGVEFDTTVKAYKSLQGANTKTVSDELTDGAYYAQHGATSMNTIRKVAKYDADASSGGYWEDIKTVSAC